MRTASSYLEPAPVGFTDTRPHPLWQHLSLALPIRLPYPITAASGYLEPSPLGCTITRQYPHQHPISQRRLGQGSGGDGQGCGTGVRPKRQRGEYSPTPDGVYPATARRRRGGGSLTEIAFQKMCISYHQATEALLGQVNDFFNFEY